MLVILIRTIVLYTLVLLVMRGMGKREIGQLQPFELVISIMIADLASIPMSDIGVPIFNGIIPILGLLIMHLMISLGNLKSIKFRQAICGKPSILIFRGKIDEEVLIKERYTVNELQERLRGKDVFNIGDVEYAILETSGEINVILKPEKRNPTLEDMNINAKYEGIAYDLVIDGVIQYNNLKKLKRIIHGYKKKLVNLDSSLKMHWLLQLMEMIIFIASKKEVKDVQRNSYYNCYFT